MNEPMPCVLTISICNTIALILAVKGHNLMFLSYWVVEQMAHEKQLQNNVDRWRKKETEQRIEENITILSNNTWHWLLEVTAAYS